MTGACNLEGGGAPWWAPQDSASDAASDTEGELSLFPPAAQDNDTDSAANSSDEFSFLGSQASSSDSPAIVRLSFDVLRVDLPMAGDQHSLKVWNHVDENLGDPGLTSLLARNGIRIGVAEASAWPALQAIFERNEARASQRSQVLDAGLPLVIVLGPMEEGQSYFMHDRQRGLRGGTFEAGQKIVRIDYQVETGDELLCELESTLVMRAARTERTLVENEGGIAEIERHTGTSFDELAAVATLRPGQFLVIGGIAQEPAGLLPGALWFTSPAGMERFETLLFVTPQPVRVD